AGADADGVAAATAAGGSPVRWRRTRLMPMPYRNAAVAPAATAQPMLAPATLLLASTTTPANPASNASERRAPIFSPKNRKPTSAVNSTVIALAIAPMPAGARCAAHANSTNGTAELIAPISASFGHDRAGNRARARHRNGSSTSAPSASRISTSGTAPKSFAATRMNRNEAPQIAPRRVSSSGVIQSRGVACASPPAVVVVHSSVAMPAILLKDCPVFSGPPGHRQAHTLRPSHKSGLCLEEVDDEPAPRPAAVAGRVRRRGPAPELRPQIGRAAGRGAAS